MHPKQNYEREILSISYTVHNFIVTYNFIYLLQHLQSLTI